MDRGLLNDVSSQVEVALMPRSKFVPINYQVGSYPSIGGGTSARVRSFVFKTVRRLRRGNVNEKGTHRMFCGETGKLLLCFHRAGGTNPYRHDTGSSHNEAEGADDSSSEDASDYGYEAEDARHKIRFCRPRYAIGYNEMDRIKFKMVKELLSFHSRHYIQDLSPSGTKTYFNIAATQMRSCGVACTGTKKYVKEDISSIHVSLLDCRGSNQPATMFITNHSNDTLATIKEPYPCNMKLLKGEHSFGDGPEYQIDVAPGVEWAAILAIVAGIRKVGLLFAKPTKKMTVKKIAGVGLLTFQIVAGVVGVAGT